MAKLVVLYPHPTDADTFERRYRDEHGPMVHDKMPGLRHFEAGRVMGGPDNAPFARVAELTFDSVGDLQAALDSADGQSVVAHAMEISTGGPITALVIEEDR
jgi:uncharacterized protein (TIGR02118 family)